VAALERRGLKWSGISSKMGALGNLGSVEEDDDKDDLTRDNNCGSWWIRLWRDDELGFLCSILGGDLPTRLLCVEESTEKALTAGDGSSSNDRYGNKNNDITERNLVASAFIMHTIIFVGCF